MGDRLAFAAGSTGLALALAAIGTFRGDDDHSMRQFLIVALIILVAAAVLFWAIVPRITRRGRGALIVAVIAVVSLVVFWLGLPPLLAGAAALLAVTARREGAEVGKARAALALSALVVAAAVLVAFVG